MSINWANVLENALGNGLADLLIGSLITIVLTRFFQKLEKKRNSIGSLILVKAEIEINKHQVLEYVLNHGIGAFEKEYHRGLSNEVLLDQRTFTDAAEFLSIPINRILSDSFYSTFPSIADLENHELLEKIVNLYMVSYNDIKTAMAMKQLNWKLVDAIKRRLQREIDNSTVLISDIGEELNKLKKQNILLESFKIWEIFNSSKV